MQSQLGKKKPCQKVVTSYLALPKQASVLSSLSLLLSSPLFPASEFLREMRQDLLMCVKQNNPNTLWELRAPGGRHGLFICSLLPPTVGMTQHPGVS